MYCEKHKIQYEPVKFFLGSELFITSCPGCEQERREKQKEEEMEERKQEAQLRKSFDELEKLKEQNIEEEFYNATLENYKPKTATQKNALEAVKKLVSGEIKKVVMLGSNGIGKTHLGSAAVKILDGRIMTAYEVSLHIRDGVAKGREKERLDELCSFPLFVIDEFGRTKMSDAEKNWHSYILDKRHVRGLRTILMGNGHFYRDCKKGGCERCLESMIDNDSISRFIQNGIILQVDGPDHRRGESVAN